MIMLSDINLLVMCAPQFRKRTREETGLSQDLGPEIRNERVDWPCREVRDAHFKLEKVSGTSRKE